MKYVTFYPPIKSFSRAPNIGFWDYALVIVMVAATLTLVFA